MDSSKPKFRIIVSKHRTWNCFTHLLYTVTLCVPLSAGVTDAESMKGVIVLQTFGLLFRPAGKVSVYYISTEADKGSHTFSA